MGLKAVGPAAVAGRLLLFLLLGATAWLAATAAPQRTPAPGAETTNWLAAHSLAVDHDELFVDADVARFRAAFGEGPRGVRTDPHSGRLVAPFLAIHAWSRAIVVAGERGPFLLNALALALAALAGSYGLRAALGSAAPLWIALFLFGSAAFTGVFRWQSEILVLAAVVVAGALIWGRESPASGRDAKQIYGGDITARAALWPWPLAGLLIGAAAVRHPAYALLALPLALDLPRTVSGGIGAGGMSRAGRTLRAVLFGLALMLPLAFVAALSGAPWEAPAAFFHPALTAWNALYFVVGRHAGVLVGFLPIVVLLFARRPTGGRRYLPLVVLAAAIAQLLMAPFDWAGDVSAVGNPWFLPLYGALLFCAGPTLSLRAAFLVAVAAAPFMAPFWIAPLSDGTRPPRALAAFTAGIRERLPFETSLRELPGSAEVVRAGVRLRSTGPSLRPADGKFALEEGRVAVLVESDHPLASVRLDFSASAPGTLTVEGGRSGSTTFRPSGEVAFEVVLGSPLRRHPLWWSRAPVSIYELQLTLPAPSKMAGQGPAAVAEPVTFDLGLARIAGPEAGSR
ncbi:MAG: hypothetical protein ABI689_09110 [Thermoanaerobaculia bacterium]